MLNLFYDLDDYFFGQGGACQLRNSSGVLGKPTPSHMDLWDVSRSRASHAGSSARPRGQAHITSSSSFLIAYKNICDYLYYKYRMVFEA